MRRLMRCPECGGDNLAVQYVERGECYVDEEGNVGRRLRHAHMEWDDDSGMRCVDCGKRGFVKAFTSEEKA